VSLWASESFLTGLTGLTLDAIDQHSFVRCCAKSYQPFTQYSNRSFDLSFAALVAATFQSSVERQALGTCQWKQQLYTTLPVIPQYTVPLFSSSTASQSTRIAMARTGKASALFSAQVLVIEI